MSHHLETCPGYKLLEGICVSTCAEHLSRLAFSQWINQPNLGYFTQALSCLPLVVGPHIYVDSSSDKLLYCNTPAHMVYFILAVFHVCIPGLYEKKNKTKSNTSLIGYIACYLNMNTYTKFNNNSSVQCLNWKKKKISKPSPLQTPTNQRKKNILELNPCMLMTMCQHYLKWQK